MTRLIRFMLYQFANGALPGFVFVQVLRVEAMKSAEADDRNAH